MRMNKLFLFMIIFLLTACSSLEVETHNSLEKRVPNISVNTINVETKVDLEGKDNADSIQKVIELEEADALGEEYVFFPIAKKIVKNKTAVYDAPLNGKILKILNKGSEVLIFDRKNNWERITIENDSPQWINIKDLCSNETCHNVDKKKTESKQIAVKNISHLKKSDQLKTNNYKSHTISKSKINYSKNKSANIYNNSCSCTVIDYCVGPRGGHYCITSGGNKRYLPR